MRKPNTPTAHRDDGPERAGKDCGEAIDREGSRYGSEHPRHGECGELDRCHRTPRYGRRGCHCDTDGLGNGRCNISNSRRDRRGYDDPSAPRRIRPKASDRNTIGQATAFGLMAIDYREPGAVCEFQPQHQLWGSGIALSLHAICESVIPLETELTTMEVKVALWAGDVDRARTLISKRMGLRIRAGSRGTTWKTVIAFRICESPMLYVPSAALVIVASS